MTSISELNRSKSCVNLKGTKLLEPVVKTTRPLFFRQIWKTRVSKFNHEQSRKHISSGFRQLAIFSHDHIGISINADGIYEKEFLELIFQWLKPHYSVMKNSTAIDIGANIGNHTLFFAKYFNEVYSFEANPRTFRLLNFNCTDYSSILCHKLGLSDHKSDGYIVEDPANIGASAVCGAETEINESKIRRPIKLDTLDNAGKNITKCFLMKM